MNEFAMRAARTGGPEVIERVPVDLPEPGPGAVRVRHHAVRVYFIDTYFRSWLYPTPLPTGPGSEAAGVVEAVGPDVNLFAVGDRVAYATGPLGAYSTARDIAADLLVPLPRCDRLRYGSGSDAQGDDRSDVGRPVRDSRAR